MKDGITRTIIKSIARAVFCMDLWMTRRLRHLAGRRSYRLGGACQLCAKCCEAPTIQTNPVVYRVPLLRRALLAWHRHVNGFEVVSEIPAERAIVFKCTHFDATTRRCDSYSTRPGMCRDYPRALLWEHDPPFLPGCGYRAISTDGGRMKEILEKEDISQEKKEKIRKAFHLE